MSIHLKQTITKDSSVPFQNNATFCIGTGRMGLALQKAYHDQLKLVQDEIHFSHIRGHGIFTDDMAIYQTYTVDGVEQVEYNFTYLDMVIDDYLSLGIKPFVELGFMPKKLASGDQTVFYWKGNVTPPKDYDKWTNLVKATLNHWFDRYGKDFVLTWPIEVWNEPNLTSFWKDADMPGYFTLYEKTSKAIKEVDERFRVGGPAICGVDDERWLKEFLTYCAKHKLPLDFVTRHAYATEAPDVDGHYVYQELRDPQVVLEELQVSRNIIDSFPQYKGMEMHITEFNTSYSPICPVHDTNLNAAYIARLLSELGDTCASYSYWTFGDIFEEHGVPYTPFHGGFGLVANGLIPKPTFWTFAFFQKLSNNAIARNQNYILTMDEKNSMHGIAWNPVTSLHEEKKLQLELEVPITNGEYVLLTRLVDEETCNPLRTWLNIGSPTNPSKEQVELMKTCASPLTRTDRLSITDGKVSFDFELKRNALLYWKLEPITPQTDRGYRPERVQGALTKE